jgi:hypothetical protein
MSNGSEHLDAFENLTGFPKTQEEAQEMVEKVLASGQRAHVIIRGSEHTPERTWLQPGDRVRLTGDDWRSLGLQGATATVIDIDIDGDPLIEDPTGGVWAVYTEGEHIDYSAERVGGDKTYD